LQNPFKVLFLSVSDLVLHWGKMLYMTISARKIWIFLLLLPALLSGNAVLAQIKGDSYMKWYSWNATVGFMMPVNILSTNLPDGIAHSFHFDGTPGYIFSIAKPIGVRFIVGAELEDQRTKGAMKGFLSVPTDTFYNFRTRTYSLVFQYYLTPGQDINPFVLAKIGYGGINRALRNRDLSRSFPADRWDLMVGAAAGMTWNATPNISVNLYGEFSTIPAKYLPELFTSLPSLEKKIFPTTRIVLSITGHTDIRVFYPFKRGKVYKNKYKSHEFLPYNRVRMRK
jgi:opacity protein-like surface antigen